MRTTVFSIIKDSLFERHYGRKPRTEIHIYTNISPNRQNVSAKSDTPQVYTFFTGSGKNDQLVVKTPRNLKENVSNNFLYQFLEKKRNREYFGSIFDQKPQTAMAGTKHTIATNENEIIHRKRASKSLEINVQNPLSTRGEMLESQVEDLQP